ncbi:MAG: hypothetical protein GKC10_07805 [Methanosarcinales archaeon]|nr:hypothetical protein [Methanosarcinales archaeon]
MVNSEKAAHKVVEKISKNFESWLADLSRSYGLEAGSSRLPEMAPRCSRCPHHEDEEQV